MEPRISAPWHRASFDRFVNDRLPRLLESRLPLTGYRVASTGPHTCCVTIGLSGEGGDIEVEYADLPQPDVNGVFDVDGVRCVAMPIASREEFDLAEIKCVGEQLYDAIEARLGEAPAGLPWDASLVRSWLPLDAWLRDGLAGQQLDEKNWLAREAHLRRIAIPTRQRLFAPGQIGRVCPFETPEGPNIGKILSVALGAEVRDGRLVVVDESPEAALGLTASMIPFLEHDDPNRTLMGANMMRQWLIPPDPEPALVRTGNEPEASDFWCGRDLLTAFVSWGIDTFEDAILVSESCAKRLSFPHPLEPGDKLSNRHGTKGTVSRIVPDDEMPHLGDGVAVDLVFSFIGCHTRMNFGQIREAVMGRIARAEGEPIVVPPFGAPSGDGIRRRLTASDLPESGMEFLTLGKDGERLDRPSTVGWVYWGKTYHVARDKICAFTAPPAGQGQGELEYCALRDLGAFETVGEHFNTCAAGRDDAGSLAERVAAGPIGQASPPTPALAELTRRLAVAGIAAELSRKGLAFRFAKPEGETLTLAHPIPSPWLRSREISEIGVFDKLDEYHAVVEANARLERMIASNSPPGLQHKALGQLEACMVRFFDALLTPEHLRFSVDNTRVLFSGRTVISPADDLALDQAGLADEIAWTLFGPLVTRELRDDREVASRTARAAETLDRIMAESWVVLYRAPAGTMPTPFVAFRPVRIPENVIRIHPLMPRLMNADFDGDQIAAFLPITEGGQREARDHLSVAGHVRRNPDLIRELFPQMAALWGLAALSLTQTGRDEIAELAGIDIAASEGFVTRDTIVEAARRLLERDGVDETLAALDRLMRRGFEVARMSGASMNPFFGETVDCPARPSTDEPAAWDAYTEELAERLASIRDFADSDVGPQVLTVKCGARGSMRHLVRLIGSGSNPADSDASAGQVRSGICDGVGACEAFAWTATAREAMGQTVLDIVQLGENLRRFGAPTGYSLLARAMRAERPGMIFALAASSGEFDPLADADSRAFVGLPIVGP